MEYYPLDCIATYINYRDAEKDSYFNKDLSEDDLEIEVIKALKEIGIDLSDAEKLKRSCHYWLKEMKIDIDDYFKEYEKANYYSANDIATYINFSETLGETFFEDLEGDEFELIVIKELKAVGINVSNRDKLYRSCIYWIEEQLINVEDYPGYQLEWQPLHKNK
jgi:hypothetical protein